MPKAENHNDEILIARLKEGDESAFANLYDKYAPIVRATAYSKLNSIQCAQEIVQDIFLDLWERRSSLNISCLPGYLSVAVKYKVINYIHKQVRVRKHTNWYLAFEKITSEDTMESVELNSLNDAVEEGIS